MSFRSIVTTKWSAQPWVSTPFSIQAYYQQQQGKAIVVWNQWRQDTNQHTVWYNIPLGLSRSAFMVIWFDLIWFGLVWFGLVWFEWNKVYPFWTYILLVVKDFFLFRIDNWDSLRSLHTSTSLGWQGFHQEKSTPMRKHHDVKRCSIQEWGERTQKGRTPSMYWHY